MDHFNNVSSELGYHGCMLGIQVVVIDREWTTDGVLISILLLCNNDVTAALLQFSIAATYGL